MKEASKRSLSRRPVEVDRTGYLSTIERIGSGDINHNNLRSRSELRGAFSTYDCGGGGGGPRIKPEKIKYKKVNPVHDPEGYEQYLKGETFALKVGQEVRER